MNMSQLTYFVNVQTSVRQVGLLSTWAVVIKALNKSKCLFILRFYTHCGILHAVICMMRRGCGGRGACTPSERGGSTFSRIATRCHHLVIQSSPNHPPPSHPKPSPSSSSPSSLSKAARVDRTDVKRPVDSSKCSTNILHGFSVSVDRIFHPDH